MVSQVRNFNRYRHTIPRCFEAFDVLGITAGQARQVGHRRHNRNGESRRQQARGCYGAILDHVVQPSDGLRFIPVDHRHDALDVPDVRISGAFLGLPVMSAPGDALS